MEEEEAAAAAEEEGWTVESRNDGSMDGGMDVWIGSWMDGQSMDGSEHGWGGGGVQKRVNWGGGKSRDRRRPFARTAHARCGMGQQQQQQHIPRA